VTYGSYLAYIFLYVLLAIFSVQWFAIPLVECYWERQELLEESYTYLASDLCSNPTVKAGTPRSNECALHERRVREGKYMGAVYDFFANWSMCKRNGVCEFLGVNLTQFLLPLCLLAFLLCTLGFVCSLFGVYFTRRARAETRWQLPALSLVPPPDVGAHPLLPPKGHPDEGGGGGGVAAYYATQQHQYRVDAAGNTLVARNAALAHTSAPSQPSLDYTPPHNHVAINVGGGGGGGGGSTLYDDLFEDPEVAVKKQQ
jgi:hypothetical protein